MDTSSLGLLLWTQSCSGGVTEGRALLPLNKYSKICALHTDADSLYVVPQCRQGQTWTYPIISETLRYTKLPSREERYLYPSCVFSFTQIFLSAFLGNFFHPFGPCIIRSHTVQEVVMLLLHYDACATVINGTAQIPKDVTENLEIRSMLEGEKYIILSWKRLFINLRFYI